MLTPVQAGIAAAVAVGVGAVALVVVPRVTGGDEGDEHPFLDTGLVPLGDGKPQPVESFADGLLLMHGAPGAHELRKGDGTGLAAKRFVTGLTDAAGAGARRVYEHELTSWVGSNVDTSGDGAVDAREAHALLNRLADGRW